jgi:hypothetical protein
MVRESSSRIQITCHSPQQLLSGEPEGIIRALVEVVSKHGMYSSQPKI